MKITNVIKALFTKDNEPIEMDLVAAEIKEGRAYLHTKGKESATYMIRSNDIRILFDEGRSIAGKRIYALLSKNQQRITPQGKDMKSDTPAMPQASAPTKHTSQNQPQTWMRSPEFEKYKKRTFSVSLYPEEYDLIMASVKEYGYKRADFLLACIQSARRASLVKKARGSLNYLDNGLVMTDLKQLIGTAITSNSLLWASPTSRRYPLYSQLVELGKLRLIKGNVMPLAKPCRLGGQTYGDQTGFGWEFRNGEVVREGKPYGDTTTFLIIGIIVED